MYLKSSPLKEVFVKCFDSGKSVASFKEDQEIRLSSFFLLH